MGSEGYVGSVLLNYLQKTSIHHISIDPVWFKYENSIRTNLVTKDVRKIEFNAEMFKEIDAIVYLAAVSNDPMGKEFAKPTDDINHIQALRVANAAKKNGVKKFIFASSCSLYGGSGSKIMHESDPLDPLTDYAKSKANVEKSLAELADINFTVICMRFATAAGPSKNLRLDLVVNDFVYEAITNKVIMLLSDGSSYRPIIDVRDMADALVWALNVTIDQHFCTLNIGFNVQNYKILELAHLVSDSCGGVEIVIPESPSADLRSYQVDFTEYENLRGRQTPLFSIANTIDGLKEQVLKINRLDEMRVKKNEFQRLRQLQNMIDSGLMTKDLYLKSGE